MSRTDLLAAQVDAVRAFNRFYTRRIGLLHGEILGSEFTLPEMRIFWELSQAEWRSAAWLESSLGMDAAYLSRIVRKFRDQGLLASAPDPRDGRIRRLTLTEKGRRRFAPLERRSSAEVRQILERLSTGDRGTLVHAMGAIRQVLDKDGVEGGVITLRDPRPGDYGWVVERHGAVYAMEHGFDSTFEGLVAGIVGGYLRDRNPARERCWIADHDGERAGCVFLVERSRWVGQLRLLLVEPSARGHGIGAALVDECIRAARRIGYRKLFLWTNDILHAARAIYLKKGFRLVKSEKHRSWGHDLVGQSWELKL